MNAPKKRRSSMKSTVAEVIELEDSPAARRDESPCLYVMEVPQSCDEELRNFHETLYGVMEQKNIQPKWISRSEVLSVSSSSSDFYVLPQFTGDEYEHLRGKGCKVIGPFVVDACIKRGDRLPKWKHPIYALSMEGAVVCFSGFSRAKKNEMSELVRKMGGVVSTDLHDKVTVLISKSCDTSYAKYTESAKLKLPILREDWITDSWKAVTESLSDHSVTSLEVYNQYRVPLFKHMVISVSGLLAQERLAAANIIELGKGTYSQEMKRANCTHLISNKNSGEKFRKAREWKNIHIVTLKWLMKSSEMGYVQKETHFDPERVRASTPTKGAKPPEDLDFSMVGPAPAGPGGLNNTTLSSGLNSSVNITPRTNNDVSVVKASFIRRESSRRLNILDTTSEERTMEEGRVVDATRGIEMSAMVGDEDFFEGLRIYLVGVPEVREGWWKKMINWSGAMRAMRPEGATHIVIVGGGQVDRSITSSGRPLLTTEWVVACMKAKRVMPHTDFIYTPSTSAAAPSGSSQSLISGRSQREKGRGGMSQPFVIPSLSTITPVPSLTTASTARSSSMRRSTNQPPPSSSVGAGGVFRGVTFKMCADFCKEESDDLKRQIEAAGGTVVASPSPSHYLLCTLLDYGSIQSPTAHKAGDIVSVFWMYRCLDSSSLVSPSSHPLFRPLPACRGSRAFEGLMVKMEGFGYEQEQLAYEALLQACGAEICQSAGRAQSRVTHVIAGGVPKEGLRMPAGMRAIDPSWIIECIVHDKVLLEDEYLFKSPAYSSYPGRSDDLWIWERCEEKRGPSREGGEITGGEGERTVGLEDASLMESEGNLDALLNMDAFDGEEEGEGERMDENAEEDSMVREITEEMGEEREEGMRTQPSSAAPSPIFAHSMETPRGKSVIEGRGGVVNQRLKALRQSVTISSPSSRSIPTAASPSQFLHPGNHPKIVIEGIEELIDEISSLANSEADMSIDRLSASGVGRMLDGMVVSTGRRASNGMETPIRGGTSMMDDQVMLSAPRGFTSAATTSLRRNVLDSARLGVGVRRVGGREGEGEGGGGGGGEKRKETIETEEESPRESAYDLPENVKREQMELKQQIAASLADMKRKEEEEKEKAVISSGTTTEVSSEGGVKVGGGRSRRKRLLNMGGIPGSEAKRAAPSPLPTPSADEVKPIQLEVGWAEDTHVGGNEMDPDQSRMLDSPVKAPARRMPTISTEASTSRGSVADRSMAGRTINKSTTSTAKPMITPAKTLRARPVPPLDDKTQVVEGRGEVVGEKSNKKAKSTAAISRRGRGKENEGRQMVFAFTAIEGVERDRLMEGVRSLGGDVSPSEGFDPMVTHVVCGKLIRNERLLGAMAASQFILKPAFVMESVEKKKWIKEDEYEWCYGPREKDEKVARLVDGIIRWKRECQEQRTNLLVEGKEGKIGAFINWRALFYFGSRSKGLPMVRIVNAGGGRSALREDLQKEDLEEMRPTHVLIDGTGAPLWNIEELRFLHSLGARIFSVDFLFKYLVTERLDESTCYLPEYKKLLACE